MSCRTNILLIVSRADYYNYTNGDVATLSSEGPRCGIQAWVWPKIPLIGAPHSPRLVNAKMTTSKRKDPPRGEAPAFFTFTSTKLSSALLQNGTFVEYQSKSKSIAVGQVVGTLGSAIQIRRYSPGRNANNIAIVTGFGANLPEIIQESADDITVIEDTDLEEFAFVFKPSELETRACWLQGITNSYICRQDHSGGHAVFQSFPHIFPRSTSEVLFDDLEAVRDDISKKLNRIAEKQGERMKLFFRSRCSDYFFDYLVWRMCVEVHACTSKRSHLRVVYPMSLVKYSIIDNERIMRIQSQQQMEVFKAIFGSNALVGSRAKPPKVGQKPVIICGKDTCNHIIPVEEDGTVLALGFVQRPSSSQPGVDLIYNDHGVFSVRLRYWKTTGKKLLEIARTDRNGEESLGSDEGSIFLGDVFDYNGETYQVTRIGDLTVSAKLYNSNIEIELDREDCSLCIQAKYEM
jgi:hypothetical protein